MPKKIFEKGEAVMLDDGVSGRNEATYVKALEEDHHYVLLKYNKEGNEIRVRDDNIHRIIGLCLSCTRYIHEGEEHEAFSSDVMHKDCYEKLKRTRRFIIGVKKAGKK